MRPWNPALINPALLTSREYMKLCNERDTFHDDRAYDLSLDNLQNAVGNNSPEGFQLIRQFTTKGLKFRIMAQHEKNRYMQRNPDPEASFPWLKIDGKYVYYTDEEIEELGLQPYSFSFRIYNEDDQVVAASQDEYGCMLIMTAQEYRGFGFGQIIGKLARTYEPGKTSGGFTPAGANNFIRVHREFVRDALKSGLYSSLVRSGQISMDRVREIVTSAKVQLRPKKDNVDLSSNSAKDWLLYGDEYGSFILYDRKLAHVIDDNRYEHFVEGMIKGYVYAMPHESAGITRIKQFGGDNQAAKAFMLALAYTNAVRDKLPLWVEPEEYDLPGFQYGPESNIVGHSAREVTRGKEIDYLPLVEEERRFRQSFDRYDEFKYRLMEMAHSKYR